MNTNQTNSAKKPTTTVEKRRQSSTVMDRVMIAANTANSIAGSSEERGIKFIACLAELLAPLDRVAAAKVSAVTLRSVTTTELAYTGPITDAVDFANNAKAEVNFRCRIFAAHLAGGLSHNDPELAKAIKLMTGQEHST